MPFPARLEGMWLMSSRRTGISSLPFACTKCQLQTWMRRRDGGDAREPGISLKQFLRNSARTFDNTRQHRKSLPWITLFLELPRGKRRKMRQQEPGTNRPCFKICFSRSQVKKNNGASDSTWSAPNRASSRLERGLHTACRHGAVSGGSKEQPPPCFLRTQLH